MASPWLSVVMPTYNGADFLPAALESVAAQGDENVEIIAVDDGSTDRTRQILEAYAAKLPLKIVERFHSGNWVANTNDGIRHATGEFVCCLHQDDVWENNRLEVLRSVVTRHPDVTLVVHPVWYIDARGKRVGLWRCPLPRSGEEEDRHLFSESRRAEKGCFAQKMPVRFFSVDSGLVIERLLVQNFIAVPAALFRREAALAVDGMDGSLWYAADWDFWLKLAAVGEVVYIPEPLAYFRLHGGSQTHGRTLAVSDMQRQLEVVLDRHLNGANTRGAGDDGIRRAAYFSLELNTLLAAWVHGQPANFTQFLRRLVALRIAGAWRYLRDSRIVQRVTARMRCGRTRVQGCAQSPHPRLLSPHAGRGD